MERMVLSRLEWVVGPLHDSLFAFRQGVSTQTCLTTFLSQVVGCESVAVFLDLEKAFELASAPAILATLVRKGVTGRMLAWVQNYIQHRTARVRYQGCRSQQVALENGTLQGGFSVPSCLIY